PETTEGFEGGGLTTARRAGVAAMSTGAFGPAARLDGGDAQARARPRRRKRHAQRWARFGSGGGRCLQAEVGEAFADGHLLRAAGEQIVVSREVLAGDAAGPGPDVILSETGASPLAALRVQPLHHVIQTAAAVRLVPNPR